MRKIPAWFRFLVLVALTLRGGLAPLPAQERAPGQADPAVFSGPPATFAPDIFGEKQTAAGALRLLTVDERVGQPRKNELVRVPVFFHAAEASADANAFIIVPVGGGAAVPFQADDIRRDATGKIARMHLYFLLDELPAWGRRQFQLQSGKNPGASLPPLPVTTAGDRVTLGGADLKLTFHASGQLAGAIAALESSAGPVTLPEALLAPSAKIIRQPSNSAKASRSNEITYARPDSFTVRSLRWSSGPVFAKLVVQLAPAAAPEDIAEYTYLVPASGGEFTQTQRLYPAGGDTVETVGAQANVLLSGGILLGAAGGEPAAVGDHTLVSVPSGLRRELRTVYRFANKALVNAKAGLSLAIVPYTQMGARDVSFDGGRAVFRGSSDFQTKAGSNSNTLRVFWGQVRFILSSATDVEALWAQQCRAFQPLTAVVDEPWATPDDLWAFARSVSAEYGKIKYWGRSFEANLVMDHFSGKSVTARLKGGPETTPDIRMMIPTQEEVAAAWKKGQGAGALDPYGITYSSSAVVPFSAWIVPSRKLDETAYRLGQAGRLVNDLPTPEGWPSIRSFANTANMKIGTYLAALWGGLRYNDLDLVRWARDAATSQNLLANYGHAQRPYSTSTGTWEPSDVLYISITDFWLRTMELAAGEDLSVHPAVYGRYFDMVDVNADIYQRRALRDEKTKALTGWEPSWWRAAFLRGQSHDHRWELFGSDPFLGLLARASDQGKIGITEACYFMQNEVGRKQNWNNLMTQVFFPAVTATKGLANYRPAPRPALPTQVKRSPATGGGPLTVTWDAVPGAVGYRIYRAEQPGGPWKWLNSPYAKFPKYQPPAAAQRTTWQAAAEADNNAKAEELRLTPKKLKKADRTSAWSKMPPVTAPALPDTLVKTTRFTDPEGKPTSLYFVTAEDLEGRESRWFPHEPAAR